ncbi:MAG: ATP-dependent RecD-like DNA helicase [Velocimicrobium sp.]
MEVMEGYVERIVYRNQENGYTVFGLENEDITITCVGTFPFINEGEFVEVTGTITEHPVYGEQIKVSSFQIKEPDDDVSMERYLGSGAIKGIGPKLATRIVKKFKKDTFRIIEEEPERLTSVKGISERIAREIGCQFEEKRELRTAMMFLLQYGISNNLSVKIYQYYGPRMYDVLKQNPYKLAEDIAGVGFKLADEIADKAGIGRDSDFRIKAGILYVLQQASAMGHTFLPKENLGNEVSKLLLLYPEQLDKHLTDMMVDKRIVCKDEQGQNRVYSSNYYYMEMNCARMLLDLNMKYEVNNEVLEKRIQVMEDATGMELDDLQKLAVVEAAKNGVLVVTGGPGTGKTTTINTIIKFFESEGLEILLAAPTGRAAKRMKETTGYEAQTVHRMLELKVTLDDSTTGMQFEKNEMNPLETDVVIIDEMSMVDIHLFYALLKSVMVGTRLILVGDVSQLPSVGPGNVLKDVIRSERFPVVKLHKIFRQAAESDIILNAHKINEGKQIALDNKSKDFFMLKRNDVNQIISIIIQLMKDKMPRYVNADIYDIQVLTPMRKGELGVERLNQILQQYVNPPETEKREKEFPQGIFREGDKVMQVKNNYQMEWEVSNGRGFISEKGSGIFNGDCGIIREINFFAETITVEFEEGKRVEYRFNDVDELELAYAITIHKSQGSEYPAVVMPILTGPRMLFNRNLLYTAVTRARKCVTIVGSEQMVLHMIENESEQKRYSSLDVRIQEM